jgi:hypothetical protein
MAIKTPVADMPPLRITTPIVSCVWPTVRTPDTKFNEGGVFSIGLLMNDDDAENLARTLDKYLEDFLAAQSKLMGKPVRASSFAAYKPHLDKEGKETGATLFRPKAYATRKTKSGDVITKTIPVFDAQGNPTSIDFGNGSKVRVNFAVRPYYTAAIGAGISLELGAVQVIEAKTGTPTTASGFGFSTTEGDAAEVGATENPNDF